MTPVLTAEQMLIIADEFCEAHRIHVQDFAALVAAAAVPGAQISGIPIHVNASAAGRALAIAVARLEPLSDYNREFGEVCRDMYRRLSS